VTTLKPAPLRPEDEAAGLGERQRALRDGAADGTTLLSATVPTHGVDPIALVAAAHATATGTAIAQSRSWALAAATAVIPVGINQGALGSDVAASLTNEGSISFDASAAAHGLQSAFAHADVQGMAQGVLALWGSSASGGLDAEGLGELEQLATDGVTPVGAVARSALARAGKARVKPALRADLAARQADRRTLGAHMGGKAHAAHDGTLSAPGVMSMHEKVAA
jgi:hypothetical protein